MTWGSNPTGARLVCQYCGQPYIDDDNPPTHYKTCPKRFWWQRFLDRIRPW